MHDSAASRLALPRLIPAGARVAVALGALLLLVPGALSSCGSGGEASGEPSSVPPTAPPDPRIVAGGLDQGAQTQLAQLTKRVEKAPTDARAWEALASAYEANRVPAGAQAAYAAAASLSPKEPKLWYRAAITSSRAGDVEVALERVARVLELEPDYGPAWRRQGTWLLDLGQIDGAQAAFERAGELMPEASDAVVGLARVALAKDQVEAAVELARTALARAPGDAYVRNILGNALRRAGLADEAKPHLVAGQNSTPRYIDPWSEEAQRSTRKEEDAIAAVEGLLAAKKWDQAIAALRGLLREDSTNSKLPLRLGVALMGARRFDEAVQHYAEATQQFPNNYDLMVARAASLVTTKDLGAALNLADEIVGRWPDRSPAYLQRGAALEAMGDVESARAAFQRASELKPSDLRGPLFEGRMLAKLRRYDEAAEVMEAALDLPGASAPLVYFRNLIAARGQAGAPREQLEAIVARARSLHGDAANSLLP